MSVLLGTIVPAIEWKKPELAKEITAQGLMGGMLA
jgi:hypothetical protein